MIPKANSLKLSTILARKRGKDKLTNIRNERMNITTDPHSY
jgi:hypothetical protein